MDFEAMNETDVREVIVRPLLHRLGFAYGTAAAIRTEVPLKYGYAFLGRKKPGKDVEIRGKADYICDVASHGRLTVEVKAPSEALGLDVVQQAHTYAAHPEIAADFFIVTNGRQTHVYRTGHLGNPLITINFEELEDRLLELKNLVGADAIRRHAAARAFVPGKPLGENVGPRVNIIGGTVTYDEHITDFPLLAESGIEGLHLPITSGSVFRSEDGLLTARVAVAKAFPLMRELNELLGHDEYVFQSTDEFFSSNRDSPTILQNFLEASAPKGTPIRLPGIGVFPTPCRYEFSAFTEAVGFIDGDTFKGVMRLEYDLGFYDADPIFIREMTMRYGTMPERTCFTGSGTFEVRLAL